MRDGAAEEIYEDESDAEIENVKGWGPEVPSKMWEEYQNRLNEVINTGGEYIRE